MTHHLTERELDDAIPGNFGDQLNEAEVCQDHDRLLSLKLFFSDLRARCFDLLGEPNISHQQRKRIESRNILLTCAVQVCDAKLFLQRHKDSYERYRLLKTLTELLTDTELAALRWLTFLNRAEQQGTISICKQDPSYHPLERLVILSPFNL